MGVCKQEQYPNFKDKGVFYLVRCFNCEPKKGRENYIMAVASGVCAWCGWSQDTLKSNKKAV